MNSAIGVKDPEPENNYWLFIELVIILVSFDPAIIDGCSNLVAIASKQHQVAFAQGLQCLLSRALLQTAAHNYLLQRRFT